MSLRKVWANPYIADCDEGPSVMNSKAEIRSIQRQECGEIDP